MPVIFIQHADDLGDRQLVVDEKIADRYLSLGFRVQACGVGRKQELLSTDRKPMVENGACVAHRRTSPLRGCSQYRHAAWERLQEWDGFVGKLLREIKQEFEKLSGPRIDYI
jgi:hypothetical protein